MDWHHPRWAHDAVESFHDNERATNRVTVPTGRRTRTQYIPADLPFGLRCNSSSCAHLDGSQLSPVLCSRGTAAKRSAVYRMSRQALSDARVAFWMLQKKSRRYCTHRARDCSSAVIENVGP